MEGLFPPSGQLDIIPVGRVAIDFNPTDYNRPLSESSNFNKYLGGSPANIAVGMARLGNRVGFLGKVSDDQFGDFVTGYFAAEGIDCSHISRCHNGEKLGLTFTEMLSPTQSSILMYRDGVADLMLHPDDVDEAYIASARCLLISGTALSASPSREAALKALAFAEKNGVAVVFDADYRPYSWKNKDEISIYTALVAEKSRIILGSREEFDLMERLTGLDGRLLAGQGRAAAGNQARQGRLGGLYQYGALPGASLPGEGAEGLWRRRWLCQRPAPRADAGQAIEPGPGNGQRLGGHARGQPCLQPGYALGRKPDGVYRKRKKGMRQRH